MPASSWIVIAVVVVIVVALAMLVARSVSRRKRTERLKNHFGPEYDRAVGESGDQGAAEKELVGRERKRQKLDIVALVPESRAKYAEYWRTVQAAFVDDPANALGYIDDWHARGVVGIRANLIGAQLPDFADNHWTALLSRMAALDWHLEMQIDAGRLDQVTPALLASGVRIVIDHFGRFDPALGMGDPGFAHLISLGQTRRVWVKGSAAYRVSAKPGDAEATSATAASAWAVLLPAFGVDRLLWGTDWPHTQFEQVCDPRRAINELHRLVIDASHRQAVLIDTPAELFHFR